MTSVPSLGALIRRASGRSAAEYMVRGGQLWRVARERIALRLGADRPVGPGDLPPGWSGPAAGASLEHFRQRRAPSFFPAFDAPAELPGVLDARWPLSAKRTVEEAERILGGSFDFLGYRGLRFGAPPDWHLDPVHGVRAPLRHWSRIPYLDPHEVGDHKVVWELNRQQYFHTLGRAYCVTGDERYAGAFVQHVESWLLQNPRTVGINWASSLEVSFRAISWIWALYYFRSSPSLTAEFYARIVGSLRAHGLHVETYLSTYFSPNTHLTGEALGLFYMGLLMPELREAPRWRSRGLRILEQQVAIQIREDGVYFEQAIWYHRYTLDFLLHILVLGRANGMDVPAPIVRAVPRLLEHLLHVQRPTGTTPLFGDDDGGYLIPPVERTAGDLRPALALGAVLLERSDFARAAGPAPEDLLWQLGASALETYDRLRSDTAVQRAGSAAFVDSGYYVLRDGSEPDGQYMLIDGGPHGSLSGGHAHADALAIVVSSDGHDILVDAGTYSYTAQPELRDALRSSLNHNTLSLDGLSSSLVSGPFRWSHAAATTVRRWYATPRFDFFDASHDGYVRLPAPAVHQRTVLFIKGDYWIMRDSVTGEGTHVAENRFHVAPDLHAEPALATQLAAVTIGRGGATEMRIVVAGSTEDVRIEPCLISPVYGAVESSVRCIFTSAEASAHEMITLLLPRPWSDADIRPVEATAGAVLMIRQDAREDWIGIGSHVGSGIETRDLSSDCDWVWLRRCPRTGAVADYVLIGGSRCVFRGQVVVDAGATFRYSTPTLTSDDGESDIG